MNKHLLNEGIVGYAEGLRGDMWTRGRANNLDVKYFYWKNGVIGPTSELFETIYIYICYIHIYYFPSII